MKNKVLNNSKILKSNLFANIIHQVASIFQYFIIPHIIISHFGSNINGLIVSITQFLGYISIIEGGITGVVSANFYKPLVEKNNKQINLIYNTASSYYKKIGFLFVVYSICVSFCFSIRSKDRIPFYWSFSLSEIIAISLFAEYMFAVTARTLINTDNKIYIVSHTKTASILFSTLVVYISTVIKPNIHVIELIIGLFFLIQTAVYNIYAKKNYRLVKSKEKDPALLTQRWDGFAVSTAAFIHNGTDIAILTLFTNYGIVSVYGVYSMVVKGIKQIINAISNVFIPVLGKVYAENDEKKVFENLVVYEFVIMTLTFIIFTVACLLITPFVLIYTTNFSDTNYCQPYFGYIIIIAEAIYLIRLPHVNLSYIANKFKEISRPSCIEAIINIVVSLLLINKFGLIGVGIGTLIAMLYRMFFHINYSCRLVPSYKPSAFYKKLFTFIFFSILSFIVCNALTFLTNTSVIGWLICGVVYTIVVSFFIMISIVLFFRKEAKLVLNYFSIRRGYKYEKN